MAEWGGSPVGRIRRESRMRRGRAACAGGKDERPHTASVPALLTDSCYSVRRQPADKHCFEQADQKDDRQGARIRRNEAYNRYAAMTKDEA